MQPTPCDKFDYNSDEYNLCVKDIVYEQAQDEWIMLDPRFPNLKGITPERIDEFLANADSEEMRDYFEDYLQHVMVYDRDDIVDMCHSLGKQIEEKYPGLLHSSHSIFVTTPRGGHEVLSIFAYTNDLKKEQIPSHIRRITTEEAERIREYDTHLPSFLKFKKEGIEKSKEAKKFEEAYEHIQKGNHPIIPDIWLDTMSNYFRNKVETVFIIDDVIASGEQIIQAYDKINEFFNKKVEIIPIVLVSRESLMTIMLHKPDISEEIIWHTQTVGIDLWDEVREFPIEERGMLYDMLITVRFPWGSPDGESDKILTTLYESRRGLERIERKQRRCEVEPDKCELK